MTALIAFDDAGWSIQPTALAWSLSTSGGCDCDNAGVVQLERLRFTSLDEPMLIQMRLQQLRRERERDRWIGRAVGAGIALTTGIAVDGLGMGDLTASFMGGVVGDVAVNGLHQLSDQQIDDLGLSWARASSSLDFHLRRHGQPLHRELLLSFQDGEQLITTCAVAFSDGFRAFFSPDLFRSDLEPFNGCRRLSGDGAMPEPDQTSTTVSSLPCSDGRRRPLRTLLTDRGPLLAMQIARPHHSLY